MDTYCKVINYLLDGISACVRGFYYSVFFMGQLYTLDWLHLLGIDSKIVIGKFAMKVCYYSKTQE